MSWVRGTHYELCECTECHDQSCHEKLFEHAQLADVLICKMHGHAQAHGWMTIHRVVVPCKRRCGYVWREPLPVARLVRR